MHRFLKPSYVLGGLALYGLSAGAAYAYFGKKVTYPSHTEEERKQIFNQNSSHYDSDVDTAEATTGIKRLRRNLVGKATGKVCEVGAGTGRNLEYYNDNAASITLVDFSEGMLEQARNKIQKLPAPQQQKFHMATADVTRLPFPDASFDSVVDTFSMCSFEHPDVALKEMSRVLKPGGQLLLLEHGRASVGLVNKMLDSSTPGHVHKHGCYWNRDIDAIVKHNAADFKLVEESRAHLGTTYSYVFEKLR